LWALGKNVYAPVDVTSRGTWVGFNDSGLALAVTNQETDINEKPARSRGLLALDLLDGYESAREAKEFLVGSGVKELYRWGNFIVADGSEAWHIVWDKDIWVGRLEPGGHAVSTLTVFPGMDWTERAERYWVNVEKRRVRALKLIDEMEFKDVDSITDQLKVIGADHGSEKGPGSLCYHWPTGEYVQTSSTIIAVSEHVSRSRVLYCPENPCVNVYTNYDILS